MKSLLSQNSILKVTHQQLCKYGDLNIDHWRNESEIPGMFLGIWVAFSSFFVFVFNKIVLIFELTIQKKLRSAIRVFEGI